jgi:hypothetical protein
MRKNMGIAPLEELRQNTKQMAEERDDELNFSTDCPTRHRSMV